MKNLKICLKPKSGFSNLFTADQIWGQMVWAISDLEGPNAASEFVEVFKKEPPFLISNMMPSGYFPKIILPPIKSNKQTTFTEDRENRKLAKSNKKNKWIPLDVLFKYQTDINQIKLAKIDKQPKIREINEIKTSISRNTWIANDGGLFNQTFLYSNETFVIYIKLLNEETKWINTLNKIIDYFNIFGLGGDKSVGKGNFTITIEKLSKKEDRLFSYETGGIFTTLSRSSGKDLKPLYYQSNYYFGIVGRCLSSDKNYNKYPILFFEPGSIFTVGKGSIIENVQENSNICSYGYAFPLYLNNEEEK
ncbi:MAG: type III-A CRISPR-associated RAMP protein Csm4 [Pleomorphochaeta sp.]